MSYTIEAVTQNGHKVGLGVFTNKELAFAVAEDMSKQAATVNVKESGTIVWTNEQEN